MYVKVNYDKISYVPKVGDTKIMFIESNIFDSNSESFWKAEGAISSHTKKEKQDYYTLCIMAQVPFPEEVKRIKGRR